MPNLPARALAALVPVSVLALAPARADSLDYAIATWRGSKDAALSLTLDDNNWVQVQLAVPALNARGFRATFFDRVDQGDWERLVPASDSGHEIGDHTVTHPGGSAQVPEMAAAKDSIERHIPGQPVVSYAYPNGDKSGGAEAAAARLFAAARGWGGSDDGVESANPADFWAIKTNSNGGTTASNGLVDQALAGHGWLVETIHCISDGTALVCHGFNPIQLSAFTAHLDYIAGRRDRLWVAPFGEVARYARERRSARLQGNINDTLAALSLTDGEKPDSIFNLPLTVRVKAPASWREAHGSQAGRPLAVELRDGYATFDAVPDGGAIRLAPGAAPAGLRTGSGGPWRRGPGWVDFACPAAGMWRASLIDIRGRVRGTWTHAGPGPWRLGLAAPAAGAYRLELRGPDGRLAARIPVGP